MTRLNGAKISRISSPGIGPVQIPEPEIGYPSPCMARIVWRFPAAEVSRMLTDIRFRMSNHQDMRSKGKRRLGRNPAARYQTNLLQSPPHDKRVIGLELLHRLAPRVWEQLGTHANFKPVAQPQFTGKPEMGKPMDLTAEVEILPRMEISRERYQGIHLYIPAREIVTEEQVHQAIEGRRFYFARYLVQTDPERVLQSGDFVALNIQERAAGTADWGAVNQAQIILGRGQVRAEIDQQLQGMRVNQVLNAAILKDDAEIEIQISVADHKSGCLPDDAELCRKENVPDMKALASNARQFLSAQAELRHQNSMRARLMDAILGGTSFPMPPSMIAVRGQLLRQELMMRSAQQGQKYQDTPDAHKQCQELATRLVREEYALHTIASQEGIIVEDPDISAEILRLAKTDGGNPLEVQARIEKGNMMEQLRQQVLFNKTLAWLLRQAKIQEEVVI